MRLHVAIRRDHADLDHRIQHFSAISPALFEVRIAQIAGDVRRDVAKCILFTGWRRDRQVQRAQRRQALRIRKHLVARGHAVVIPRHSRNHALLPI